MLSGPDRVGPQGRDGRGRGAGLRLQPRRRPDPHPPGSSAAGVARRPRLVAAREADADDHRRLLGGARRDDLGDDRSPSPACEGWSATRITRRSSASGPRSRGGREAASTRPTAIVAGVCDFAEPRGNHGLYASPRSIHRLLDRNRLTALYAPAAGRSGTLLAQGRASTRRASTPTLARAQSPDRDESSQVTIPPPALLGIQSPTIGQDRTGRTAWQSRPATPPTGRARCPDGRTERRAGRRRRSLRLDERYAGLPGFELDTGSGPGPVGSGRRR